MLIPPQALVFLLDVDNTLLDSDRFKLDLSARLLRDFGNDGCDAFWQLHAERIKACGYADHLGTVQAFRAGRDDDPLLLNLAEFLLEYPFSQRLFPRALEAIAHLGAFGLTVVLTDGDRVFQPRKLRRSGIWAAVDGRVMIPLQKQYALEAMQRRYPAEHYVMLDDKPLLLSAMKRVLGPRLTTVFVKQGHYAQESACLTIDPAPDVVIERIGALIDFDRSQFAVSSEPLAYCPLPKPAAATQFIAGPSTQSLNQAIVQVRANLKQSEQALDVSQTALAASVVALADAQASETEAIQKSLHDSATGLPNRELFNDRLSQAIAVAERHGWTLAVLFIDLDRFKAINDTHGHAAGDAVLKAVADRLVQHCRRADTLCRCGGDEFLFLLLQPQGEDNIEQVARMLLKTIALPIEFGAVQLAIRASIGISHYPADGLTPEVLIGRADTAMYEAKKAKSGVAFFKATPQLA